jgi:hypothetical protein
LLLLLQHLVFFCFLVQCADDEADTGHGQHSHCFAGLGECFGLVGFCLGFLHFTQHLVLALAGDFFFLLFGMHFGRRCGNEEEEEDLLTETGVAQCESLSLSSSESTHKGAGRFLITTVTG